jgi:hypothetical protein
MRERYRFVGVVRAIEVTHGCNGWHPHIHAILLIRRLTTAERDELRAWIAHRWRECVRRVVGAGGVPTLEDGCDLRECHRADYVAKLGLELTAPAGKVARLGNRSPLAIATDFLSTGDESDLILWQAYASGMRGARMLTWSHGLRIAAGLREVEKTDEEIVEGERGDETIVAVLEGSDWDDVRDRPTAKLALLIAAERGGIEAVRDALSRLLGTAPARHGYAQQSKRFSGDG